MTDIAFHFNMPDKLAYACRLLRKAVNRGAKVVVIGSEHTLAQLNIELWRFAPQEFVPHCDERAPEAVRAHSPVLLLADLSSAPHHEVLLNLNVSVMPGFEPFARVIELVSTQDVDRAQGRQRWRHYQNMGYTIVKFDVADKEPSV